MKIKSRLYISNHRVGIAYHDREKWGSSDQESIIASYFFGDMTLVIHDNNSPLLSEVEQHAAQFQAGDIYTTELGRMVKIGFSLDTGFFKYNVGDTVTWANEYGVTIGQVEITGLDGREPGYPTSDESVLSGVPRYYVKPNTAYWHSIAEENLIPFSS